MKKLEGGFINNVYLENGLVVKSFENDSLVGISSAERIGNETRALSLFGGTIAPRLISLNGTVLCQEFIEGESYETRARRGEKVFKEPGVALALIHNFCTVPWPLHTYYQAKFAKAVNLAGPILKLEELFPEFVFPRKIVYEFGSRYIHGDFWLGNLIGKQGEKPTVIDWEFSGIGSPFEDFAIADLWIFREFPGSSNDFWEGYSKRPDQKTIDSFLVLKCVEFLATTTLENYLLEEKNGFYHNKIDVLKTLLL